MAVVYALADGSLDPHDHVATWGTVVWSGDSSWSSAGICPPEVTTSALAEFYAVLQAVRAMRRFFSTGDRDRFCVYTDCEGIVPWCKDAGKERKGTSDRDARQRVTESLRKARGNAKLRVTAVPRDEVIEAHVLCRTALGRMRKAR